jgi:hypothetical protein
MNSTRKKKHYQYIEIGESKRANKKDHEGETSGVEGKW